MCLQSAGESGRSLCPVVSQAPLVLEPVFGPYVKRHWLFRSCSQRWRSWDMGYWQQLMVACFYAFFGESELTPST